MVSNINIQKLYTGLKTKRERYKPLWDDISKFVGINVDTDYQNNNQGDKSKQVDEFVDDPTSAISVNQAGDYLLGIMWGTGDKIFNLVPSIHVTELVDEATVKDWFAYATRQSLYHMNHAEAGLVTAMKSYSYDQFSFGTSGIGGFPNKEFINGVADNAIIYRQYGVDNMVIDDGKSGQAETVGATYHWGVNRIVGEFCTMDGDVNKDSISRLPKDIQDAWRSNDINKEFTVVFLSYPRTDYNPKLKGQRGMRYEGVWFMDKAGDNKTFFTEYFAKRPIAVCRAIKLRGEVWGRSSGTMLLSSIRSVNFMLATTIEIIEKLSNPSLGILSNAIFGDSVLDTSPDGLTVFNSALMGDGKTPPVFPLHDVGDPSGIIKFIIPYLNEKIVTAFKIDALLDFSSAKNMTATESLQRYAIRGKSLSGMLTQQKNELLIPLVDRSISILMGLNELGINPKMDEEKARQYKETPKLKSRIIPQAVLDVIESGKPWFEIKFNNELEKLTRTEAVQNLIQVLNAIMAIFNIHPEITLAVDWYKLLKDINDNLDSNNQILYSAEEFKTKVEKAAQAKQLALQMQAGQAGADIQAKAAQAGKLGAETQQIKRT